MRPNILVITTDQQYAGAMSCTGNPFLHTPAMDRIAAEGTRFERAYCSNPICVPSRASYMTGTMPHENGIDYNAHTTGPFLDKEKTPCLARFFREAGYDTGYFGKWHIPLPVDDPAWSGFNTTASIRDNEVDFDIVEPCLDFIRTRRDQPFLAFASFVNPHDICEYARMLSDIPDRLKNGEIGEPPPLAEMPPLPANWAPPPDEPEAIRIQYNHPDTLRVYPSRTWGGPEDPRWRQYLWGHYRMTELVDAYIGQLLDGLERAGLAENTLIVLSSDHGDGMSSHHWNQKTMFYDECARVPFIVRWAKHTRAAAVDRSTLVNLGTDLFPTLFDAAGIDRPAHLKGLSVLPATRGDRRAPAHPFIVVQNNLQTRFGERVASSGRMLRSPRYKYVRYNSGTHPEQLFDMEVDPLETRSLVYDPEHAETLARHRQWLDEWMKANGDTFGA
jgi:arylsulfatase A-like enzyme